MTCEIEEAVEAPSGRKMTAGSIRRIRRVVLQVPELGHWAVRGEG